MVLTTFHPLHILQTTEYRWLWDGKACVDTAFSAVFGVIVVVKNTEIVSYIKKTYFCTLLAILSSLILTLVVKIDIQFWRRWVFLE